MKVQLESTSKIVTLVVNGTDVPARLWEGQTTDGIPCHAYITRIAVNNKEDTSEFERDLKEQPAPSPEMQAIPLRMIL